MSSLNCLFSCRRENNQDKICWIPIVESNHQKLYSCLHFCTYWITAYWIQWDSATWRLVTTRMTTCTTMTIKHRKFTAPRVKSYTRTSGCFCVNSDLRTERTPVSREVNTGKTGQQLILSTSTDECLFTAGVQTYGENIRCECFDTRHTQPVCFQLYSDKSTGQLSFSVYPAVWERWWSCMSSEHLVSQITWHE